MPNVYLIAKDRSEQKAVAGLLSAKAFCFQAFDSVEDFLKSATPDPAGCVILDLLSAEAGSMQLLADSKAFLPVIVVSQRADVAAAVQAMKEGAADFLEKPLSAEALAASVEAAAEAGRIRIERERRKQELISRFRTLSARERDVVDAVLGGCGNREVATQLGIRPRTVETHRSNAMVKLGARTLPDLVRIWMDLETGPSG